MTKQSLPPTLINSQWLYRKRPEGLISDEHYELVSTELSMALAVEEVLIEAKYISVDPYMRINQAASKTWMDPHPFNTVQAAAVVAQVLASNSTNFAPGDWVTAYSGWQTHAKCHSSALGKLDPDKAPVTTALGVLGMPGRTAWFGLLEAGRPKAGEVVVVSGAAGAVGSLVVQLAKKQGAIVVGIAGGVDKCEWVRHQLKADFTIDYKQFSSAAAIGQELARQVPGVDVYFDNVGGQISDAVLSRINLRARIIICGQISQYSGGLDQPEIGPRLMHHVLYQRATIQGILARDYTHRMDEMLAIVAPWVRDGSLHFEQHLIHGFAQLPDALNSLFTGDHRGKVIVQVD
jgi:NADPH-dependent curcumin reductase CurA